MKGFKFLILIFFLSIKLNAQTKLIIYSEDHTIFLAYLNNVYKAKEGNDFFEFININIQNVILEVKLDNNQHLKKAISLKKDFQNIYSILNENGVYKIFYRGYYALDEDLPDFEFNKDLINNPGEIVDCSTDDEVLEVDNARNELVNINTILSSIENKTDKKEITQIIISELSKGKYNCRQLKFIFSKLHSDYSKLYIFKSTVNSCLDKENLHSLKNSFETKKSRLEFNKLISSL